MLPITDPNGTDAGETRATFDNIDDYNGLTNSGVIDQNGNTITGLENYTISVAIADKIISNITMKASAMAVSIPSVTTINLVGYRASYE
ncbi:MAG: hypothetical protein Q9N32_05725 [Gammaproteobacteria bacterium]|nr:hypothetical protein [Gammaproteobacteria bacterium]